MGGIITEQKAKCQYDSFEPTVLKSIYATILPCRALGKSITVVHERHLTNDNAAGMPRHKNDVSHGRLSMTGQVNRRAQYPNAHFIFTLSIFAIF